MITPLGALLILIAGFIGVYPPVIAVGAAAAVATVPIAAALVARALATRAAARATPALPGACRCDGLLGLGTLTVGLTAATLPLTDPPVRPVVTTGGLALAATLIVFGLLHLPGVADRPVARLRRALDGLVIGVSMAVVGWLLPATGTAHPLAYASAAVVATSVAIVTALVLRGGRSRSVMLRCGVGAGAGIIGLALLAVMVEGPTPGWTLLAVGILLVVGPVSVLGGARRVDPATPPRRSSAAEMHVGDYPAVALPVGAVVLAYAYQLLVAGPQANQTAVVLGLALGALLAGRELLTASDLRRCTRGLASQQAHLGALVAGASDVTVVVDAELRVRWRSPAAWQQFGLAESQMVGRRFTELVHPDDAAQVADRLRAVLAGAATPPDGVMVVEARLRDGQDRWRETESTVSDLRASPEVGALVMQVRDVGQRRTLERTLQRLTSTDQLTGLANRRELLRAVESRRGAGYRSGTLLVIDLSGVGALNHLRGRAVGDAVLVAAAQRLRGLVCPEDVVARLEERQFAVLTTAGPIEAYALGFRLLTGMGESFSLPDQPVQLVVSVGLTTLAEGLDADEVVRRGDLALRRASQFGHSRIDWYDEGLEQRLVRRLDLERHLPGATGRGELGLVYQPVVDLVTHRPVGVEALLRWHHPVLGTVLPGELLPVADRLRLTWEIGEWVLHTACRQVAEWRRAGHDLWLSINVSASQFAAAEFASEVAVALSIHQTPPERLIVEVAESEVGDDPTAIAAQLSRLRALGVRTALDDFGTGQTDLARLRRLPLDLVKLSPLATTGDCHEVPTAMPALTRRLGLSAIAKGLETEAQQASARRAGCRYGQGLLIAPPASAEHVAAYLAHRRVGSR